MVKIMATGSYLPERVLTNYDIEQIVDTSDAWIKSRTGIVSRHIAQYTETTAWMAAQAAKDVMQKSNLAVSDIDLIIVATTTPDMLCPNMACQVQKEIGAEHASCFDINAGCSGFLFALQSAYAYLKSHMYHHALIIGAETVSSIIDWKDRSTCILFGDGAGAVLISDTDNDNKEGSEVVDIIAGSDGVKGDVLACQRDGKLQMNGQEVFKFALTQVPKTIRELLNRNQLQAEDVDWYLLHQANQRILSAVARRLKLPESKFPMNLDSYGNTSAASIPILLNECADKGILIKGQKIILAGFGAGLTWSSALLHW